MIIKEKNWVDYFKKLLIKNFLTKLVTKKENQHSKNSKKLSKITRFWSWNLKKKTPLKNALR